MSIIKDTENWISTAIHNVLEWIKGAEKKLASPIAIAENVLNALKSFDTSVIGQTVIAVVETAAPQSKNLISAFELQLPIWIIELNWIQKEEGKTLEEQWADALKYLESIKDADVYASQLNSLKALFIKFFGTNAGQEVTIQQSLTLAQPTHAAIA